MVVILLKSCKKIFSLPNFSLNLTHRDTTVVTRWRLISKCGLLTLKSSPFLHNVSRLIWKRFYGRNYFSKLKGIATVTKVPSN